MTDRPEFAGYLESIATTYVRWWDRYTLMDAIQLTVQTVQPRQTEERSPMSGERSPEKIEKLPVLEGILKYAADHVLLSGKPGSGKSTALKRLLLNEADRAGQGETDKIPVLVELRSGKAIAKLIQETLRRHRLKLTDEQIDDLLFDSKLLLLVDGVNEIVSVELLQDLEDFRANNPTTPMIFTTRNLGLGGDLGVTKKLEMQPLNELQMREFVSKYLPSQQGSELLRQLQRRLRELGETPLLLKMLCDVFGYAQQIPQNKGELFRGFDRDYDQFKRIDTISADLRRWKSELLQHLAFRMMQGKEATQPMLQIARLDAEKILEELLCDRVTSPGDKAKTWLEDLLEHHLLQVAGDRTQIEFHHQLFQEYYAAEYLLHQLPELLKDEQRFQKVYLNFLKWTEPIALILGLVENEGLALRVVELAIGVDLMLGAKLAGAVKSDLQKVTVGFILSQNVPKSLKLNLLGETHSDVAIPSLLEDLQSSVDVHRQMNSAFALRILGSKPAVPELIRLLTHQDERVVVNAALVLGAMGDSSAIPDLLNALNHSSPNIRAEVASSLGELSAKEAVPKLIEQLKDEDHHVRQEVVAALGEMKDENSIPELIKIALANNHLLSHYALKALKKINSEKATEELLSRLEHINHRIRDKAIEALGIIGSASAVESLLEELLKGYSANCWIVAEALKEIGGQS